MAFHGAPPLAQRRTCVSAGEEQEEEESAVVPAPSESKEEEEEEEGKVGPPSSRAVCGDGCGRPRRVCLCPYLPPSPVATSTSVVVLQHPHELRRRLSTSPLLPRCLLNCHLVPGRRLQLGSHPLLDSLHHLRSSTGGGEGVSNPDALFLFPSTVSSGAEEVDPAADGEEELSAYRGKCRVLIVFDGTWKHTGEMVRASLPFLCCFARRISLAGGRDRAIDGESMFESELALRKEPSRGCLSTMEAVARALGLLEPRDGGEGADVERVLLSVLRAMVGLQRSHLEGKTVRPRPRLLKKGVKKEAAVALAKAETPEEVAVPAASSLVEEGGKIRKNK
ncbi:hypothetical protein Taro_052074 [Colocasia esculenta]|uniref:tRNA-uridine aminocarboxypropyltransferase n=1 Tax=Colocasia esculenta TaxID=4460 RepID=A0A843XHM3_COLES|nr:hypothetical protein [Colocasia esculenta]